MKKRILSIILAISMLFTLCVPTAYATEISNAGYYTIGGVFTLYWSDVSADSYTVNVYDASTSALIWSGTTTANTLYARTLGLSDGTTFYFTVAVTGSSTVKTSENITYSTSAETFAYLVSLATYDASTGILSWYGYGEDIEYQVDVYSSSGTLVRTLYTANTYISAETAFVETGEYYYKLTIVDTDHNAISGSEAWVTCRSDSTYSYTAASTGIYEITFNANGGYFSEHSKATTLTLETDSSGKLSSLPTDWFYAGYALSGWYTASGSGYEITTDTVFSADTTVYAMYTTCDHSGNTNSTSCTDDTTCSVCGGTISATGHTTEIQNAVDATCTTDGYTGDEVCTVCGETVTAGEVITATGHNYVDGVCIVCGAEEPQTHTHSYTSEVTTEATCTEDGVMTYTCSCGDSYTETIPATGHTTEIQNAVDATCTEDGYTGDEVCTVCGETVTAGETIEATGHYYPYTAFTWASDYSAASATYTCRYCGNTETVDATITTSTTATCTEAGKLTYTASIEFNGNIYRENRTVDVSALGHTTEIRNAVDATCTTDGYTGDEVCTVCEEIVTAGEVIPATGHNYENGVCTVCGEAEPGTPATGDVDNGSASVTVSDSENSSIKPDVINESYVSVGTVTINTTETDGTLEIKTVTDSISGELTYSEPSTGNSVSLSTSSDITVKSVISGTATNSSGTEFTAKGTVLFYGDLSFTDEGSPLDVSSSTFTIDLTPTGTSTIDADSLVVLHYTGTAWEQLEISATVVDTSGKITVSFKTTTLSPIMVLTTSASYGYVYVGEVTLDDGYYTTDGETSSNENLPTSGYAYYSGGVLYLNAFEYTYTGTASEFSLIKGGSYELTVDLCDTKSTLSGGAYGIYCQYNFTVQNGELILDLDVSNSSYTVGLYNYNYNFRRDITLNDCKLTITAPYGSAISSVGDVNIIGSTLIMECTDATDSCVAIHSGGSFGGNITITDSTIEATVTIDNTVSVDEAGNACCIDATNGTITITNSTITATVDAGNGAVDGVIAASDDITITNSTVTLTSSGNSVWSILDSDGDLIIEDGSTVTTTGEGKYAEDAIWVKGAITISESNVTSTITNLDTGTYPAGTDDEDKVPEWWEYDVYAIRAKSGNITVIDSNVEATVVLKNYSSSPDFTINGIAIAAANDSTEYSFVLSPSSGTTMSVKLSKTGTPTTYSSQTTITNSAWSSYDYVLISTTAVVTHTHTYTSEVTTEATCTEDGVMTYTCTECGDSYTETIPATGHTNGSPEVENEVAATCTTAGSYDLVVYCSVCGEELSREAVTLAATGHSYRSPAWTWATDYSTCTATFTCANDSSHVVTETAQITTDTDNATCTADGKTTYTATVTFNGLTYTDTQEVVIPATGHTTELQNAKAATCTEDGYTGDTVCTVCGETIQSGETIPATGHTWDEGTVTTVATCTEDGEMTYTCTVCGDSYTETIPATGHTYTATFTWGENYATATVELKCSCGEVVTDNLTVNVTNISGIYVASVVYDSVTYCSDPVETITVTWYDEDSTELRTAVVEKSETVSHGTDPTKASDDQYEYTFAGWTEESYSYGNITYTATYTATPHTYTATFTWADDLNSATATLTCSCGYTVDSSSLDVLVTSVNRLGVVTRTATVTFNGVTYTDQKVTGKSLLTVQANYAAVTEAIARANALNASDYVDFSAVTAAINAVQWNLNVLNQNAVNAYAEAINTAIDNLVAVSETVTEETVVIDEPIEETDIEAEPDETETLEVSDPEPEADSNPTTGIVLTAMPLALALAAVVLGKKK
ncbi:MAG: InlB B-repeat-containing protein [Oscillospiraceae bacterium]|nr:InlB B-repeat-containing protein [Oscillospiraceae bacterium]